MTSLLKCVTFVSLLQATLAFTPSHSSPKSAWTILTTENGKGSTMRLYGTRENEIRRKIMALKKEGRIKQNPDASPSSSVQDGKNPAQETSLEKLKRQKKAIRQNSSMDAYSDKVSKRLGNKGKLLSRNLNSDVFTSTTSTSETGMNEGNEIDMNDDDDDDNRAPTRDDMDDEEQEMLQSVEAALERKLMREAKANAEKLKDQGAMKDEMEEMALKMEEEQQEKLRTVQVVDTDTGEDVAKFNNTTSGIGGAWSKNQTSKSDTYRPVNGGWGYFPRPKDISKAYGGGKKITAETTLEDEMRMQKAVENTRDKLQRYREKVGIEVQSEKDHAQEIQEALELGQRAMQRGVYGTAVTILEKVTKWCSTNSPVGGQIFLELAMAYEAVGRTDEAIQVYSTLTTSRMENIKMNAKKLLYGIEAMQFMRNEAKMESFSRKKTSQTFIDTTGLGNIAQNFDKVYNTAYIDLDRKGGYYKKITQSVVRSVREARLILLKATGTGEVEREKIVQALRSIERKFSEALQEEIKRKTPKPEPVAIMNGVPITSREEDNPSDVGLATFNLGDMDQVLENMDGEWRLQLIADNKGDGVSFFNKTVAWQNFDVQDMKYNASGPSGFLTLSQSGGLEIDDLKRIITRKKVEKSGSAAIFTDVYSSKVSGATGAVNLPQQIMSIDSELMVTRLVTKISSGNTVKGYFSVWRRAEKGTFS